MNIYLTSKKSNERLRIPLLPDRLSVNTGAYTIPLNIVKTGEVRIPRGATLTGYSWNGVFPGESMSGHSFVFDWQEPQKIIKLLTGWEHNGETLVLSSGELGINSDVFIESFSYEFFGIDNVSYTINLTVRKELFVTTTAPPPVKEKKEDDGGSGSSSKAKKYGTVKTGGSNLNVRKKPSTSAKILGKLKNKSKVEILGKKGNWYIIPYAKGTDGKAYIYASYVKLDASGSSSGSKKKSSSSSGSKKKTSSTGKKTTGTTKAPKSSTTTTTGKQTLTVTIPTKTLKNAAHTATKVGVNKNITVTK